MEGFFYIHTNEMQKIIKLKCKVTDIKNIIDFIKPKKFTIIGGLEFLIILL